MLTIEKAIDDGLQSAAILQRADLYEKQNGQVCIVTEVSANGFISSMNLETTCWDDSMSRADRIRPLDGHLKVWPKGTKA